MLNTSSHSTKWNTPTVEDNSAHLSFGFQLWFPCWCWICCLSESYRSVVPSKMTLSWNLGMIPRACSTARTKSNSGLQVKLAWRPSKAFLLLNCGWKDFGCQLLMVQYCPPSAGLGQQRDQIQPGTCRQTDHSSRWLIRSVLRKSPRSLEGNGSQDESMVPTRNPIRWRSYEGGVLIQLIVNTTEDW